MNKNSSQYIVNLIKAANNTTVKGVLVKHKLLLHDMGILETAYESCEIACINYKENLKGDKKNEN